MALTIFFCNTYKLKNIPEGYCGPLRSYSAIQCNDNTVHCVYRPPRECGAYCLLKYIAIYLDPWQTLFFKAFFSAFLSPSWQVMISKDLLDIICIMKVQSLLSGTIDCRFYLRSQSWSVRGTWKVSEDCACSPSPPLADISKVTWIMHNTIFFLFSPFSWRSVYSSISRRSMMTSVLMVSILFILMHFVSLK